MRSEGYGIWSVCVCVCVCVYHAPPIVQKDVHFQGQQAMEKVLNLVLERFVSRFFFFFYFLSLVTLCWCVSVTMFRQLDCSAGHGEGFKFESYDAFSL